MNLIQQALKNIKSGPLMSFLGGFIFVLCVVALVLSKITFTEFLEGVGLSIILLGSPDPNGKKGNAAIFIAVVCIAIICLSSCLRPSTSHTTKTEVKYRDSLITVPGDKVSAGINDSLYNVLKELLRQGKKPEVVYRNSPSSPTNLTVKLDDQGRVRADCITDEQSIKAMIKEIITATRTDEVHVKQVLPMWVIGVLLVLFAALVVCLVVIINFSKNKNLS